LLFEFVSCGEEAINYGESLQGMQARASQMLGNEVPAPGMVYAGVNLEPRMGKGWIT